MKADRHSKFETLIRFKEAGQAEWMLHMLMGRKYIAKKPKDVDHLCELIHSL
jgi:hypothetical protein